MNAIKQWWSGLSSMQKIIATIIIAVIVWLLIKWIKGYMEALQANIKNKSEIQVLQSQGIQQSYKWEKYQGWANELERAMDGPGTDEKTIFRIFGYMNNDIDFLRLFDAFGMRKGTYEWFSDPTNLREWLKGDLSSRSISSLNQVLAAKNMTKRI
jgi:hypothetical protein